MKKSLSFLLVVYICFCIIGCNKANDIPSNNSSSTVTNSIKNEEPSTKDENTSENIFYANSVSEYTYYNQDFNKYFSPKEYVELCLKFKEKSFNVEYAISKNYLIVSRFVSLDAETLKSVYEYLIITTEGNIIRNYGDNSWLTDTHLKLGDFTFITLQRNPGKYELINKNTDVVSTLEFDDYRGLSYVGDAGNGYYLFSSACKGQFKVYILNPTGQYYNIPTIRKLFINYNDLAQSLENDEIKVGRTNDEVFYFTFISGKSNHTIYFNNLGESVDYNTTS